MNHRWLLGLLLAVAATTASCAPTEGGDDAVPPTPGQADFYDGY